MIRSLFPIALSFPNTGGSSVSTGTLGPIYKSTGRLTIPLKAQVNSARRARLQVKHTYSCDYLSLQASLYLPVQTILLPQFGQNFQSERISALHFLHFTIFAITGICRLLFRNAFRFSMSSQLKAKRLERRRFAT